MEEPQNKAMLGSLRGNEYQMLVTLMAVIKAGILMKQDNCFECIISTEERDAGKFDDVIFHNTFRAMSRTLNVQAKNRMSEKKISWEELVEKKAKGAFPICKYFTSFMTTKHHHTQGVQYLVLCTNVDLDDNAKSLFETFNLPEACDIFSDLGGTCYRFTKEKLKTANKYDDFVKLLTENSDSHKLSILLAEIIFDQKELDLTANNPQRPDTELLYKYSHVLNSLIGQKREKSAVHELQEKFITGSGLTPNEMKFRDAFEDAYKLKVGEVWEDVKAKGIKIKSKAKKQLGTKNSDHNNLANLLADIIYFQKTLDLTANIPQRQDTSLLHKYSDALSCLIGEKRENSTIHNLQENFITGSGLTTHEIEFREAFELAYKLKVEGVWEDVKTKGIEVKNKPKHFPEDYPTKEDIEMFFQQFVFATNAEKLAERIKNILIESDIFKLSETQICRTETQAAFDYLYKIIYDWISQQSDLPGKLEAKDVQNILKKFMVQLKYLYLKNISTEYIKTIKVGKRCIKNEPLMKLPLHDFLKSNPLDEVQMPAVFTFYSSYEPRISLLILLETFKVCFNETDHPEFIFIKSNKYNEHKQTLQEILCLLDFRFLLIIECKDTTFANQLKHEMISAFQSLEPKVQKIEKKVVIIAQIRENDPFNLGSENSLVLEQFFEDSFEHIIPKYTSITMFGTDILLSALMDDQDDVQILLELMEDHNRTMMQRSLTEEHYKHIEKWYIQRDFKIQKTPMDNASSKFDNWMENDEFSPPCFNESDKLDWKSFMGCFPNFLNDENYSLKNELTTTGQPNHNPPSVSEGCTTKVHIFLDQAGSGKTTYFSWLGGYLQNSDRTWWVIRFNSIDYSTDFKRLSEGDQRENMDDSVALRILYLMIHLGLFVRNINHHTIDEIDREREVAQQCASLMTIPEGKVIVDEEKWKRLKWTPLQLVTVRFFAEQFNNRKLVILFDGFDEVVPHYKELVYEILSRFENFEGIRKMYIASRPYNPTDEFSKVFRNVTYYKLNPFSGQNILTMVHLFMKSEFESPLGSKDVEYFIKGLSRAVYYYLDTLSQVPLYIRMALDVLRPSIALHVDFNDCTVNRAFINVLETAFEPLNLIEKLVENKIANANVEKIQLTDSASNIPGARSSLEKLLKHTLNSHSLLSLYVLFDHKERKRLPIDELLAIECMDEVNNGKDNCGMIVAVVGDRPIFIHRTFAEYFAARWFYRNMGNEKVLSFLKSFAFWESNRVELRDFFDRMIIKQSGKSPIHVAILDNAVEIVENMIEKNPEVLCTLDAGGRSILHLLVFRSRTNILAKSLSVGKCDSVSINQKDAILQWSPFDYALVTFDTDACRDLLKLNSGLATISTSQLIEIILSHDVPTILRKTFQYGQFINELKKLCNTSKGTLEQLIAELQASVANFLFMKKIDLHATIRDERDLKLSPLEYFVSNNDGLMVKALAKRARHFAELLTTRQDHYVLLAFERKAVDVLQILMFELYCKVPAIVKDQHLLDIIEESVARSMDELSVSLFKLYCNRTKVEYIDHVYESFCYAYNFLDREEMFNPPGIDTGILFLLRTSFKHSKIDHAKRFLQVAKLDLNSFTYPFIVESMKECKLKDIGVHWACEEALQHLIDNTADLHAVDQDGKTLLHIALENNCFRVAQYLIDEKNFSSHQLDETKRWNSFFYCLMRQSTQEKKYTLIAHEKETRRKFFEYIMQKEPFDCITVRDADGRNVLYLAVMNRHFSEAKYIVDIKLEDRSPDDRRSLLNALLIESGVLGTSDCDDFLKHVR